MVQIRQCGSLKENGPYGFIWRCGLVGVGVAILEEVHHHGVGIEASETQARPSTSFTSCCLLIEVRTLFLLQDHVCLHVTILPTMMIMDHTSVLEASPNLMRSL